MEEKAKNKSKNKRKQIKSSEKEVIVNNEVKNESVVSSKEKEESLSSLTIGELINYKDACILLVDFYAQEFKITENPKDIIEKNRNMEARKKNMEYNQKFFKIIQ